MSLLSLPHPVLQEIMVEKMPILAMKKEHKIKLETDEDVQTLSSMLLLLGIEYYVCKGQ